MIARSVSALNSTPTAGRAGAADLVVVGAGAAGMYVALRAAEAGARVVLVSRKRFREAVQRERELLGPGRASGGAGPGRLPGAPCPGHDRQPAGVCAARRRSRHSSTRRPRAVQELIARGVGFDTGPDGSLALGAGGRPLGARRIVHAGGSATGKALTDRLIELVQASPGIDVRERTSVVGAVERRERCAGVITDHGPVAAAGDGAGHRRRGRALGAHHQSLGRDRGRLGARVTRPAPSWPIWSSASFTRRHWRCPGSDHDGTLLTEALRGEGAVLLDVAGRRFTDELAPRDQLTAAILDRMDATARTMYGSTCAAIDPARFPNVFAACQRGRSGSGARARPGRSRRPLPDRRHRLRPRRAHHAARPLRGRRVLVHRRARREPPRLQLAHRMLRIRGSCRRSRRSRASPRPPAAGAGVAFHAAHPLRRGRRCGALPAPGARPPSSSSYSDDPYPLARLIAHAALSRQESRGAHRRADFPDRDPSLDGVHLVIDRDGQVRREHWS